MAAGITDDEWDTLSPENFETPSLLRAVDAVDALRQTPRWSGSGVMSPPPRYPTTYDDYRTQLLPWEACEARLARYCQDVGLPLSGGELVATLRRRLGELATEVDDGFPDNSELTIDSAGTPHLKRQRPKPLPADLQEFHAIFFQNFNGRNQSSAQACKSTGYEGQKTLNSREQNAHCVIFHQVRGALGWLRLYQYCPKSGPRSGN